MQAVTRETKSKVFGDGINDFNVLADKLGGFKLSRLQANELNIYARGGVSGIEAHLRNSKELKPVRI